MGHYLVGGHGEVAAAPPALDGGVLDLLRAVRAPLHAAIQPQYPPSFTDFGQAFVRRYEPDEIEPKWVERWEAEGLYAAVDQDDGRPRFYALDMFSYPSGDLHMGHMEAFSGGDAIARYR